MTRFPSSRWLLAQTLLALSFRNIYVGLQQPLRGLWMGGEQEHHILLEGTTTTTTTRGREPNDHHLVDGTTNALDYPRRLAATMESSSSSSSSPQQQQQQQQQQQEEEDEERKKRRKRQRKKARRWTRAASLRFCDACEEAKVRLSIDARRYWDASSSSSSSSSSASASNGQGERQDQGQGEGKGQGEGEGEMKEKKIIPTDVSCADVLRWKVQMMPHHHHYPDDTAAAFVFANASMAGLVTVWQLQALQDEIGHLFEGCRVCAATSHSTTETTTTTTTDPVTSTIVHTTTTTTTNVDPCSFQRLIRSIGYDDTAPPTLAATTPSLRSIPSKHKIPPHVLSDHDRTVSFIQLNMTQTHNFALLTFNPSIVHAPSNVRREDPNAAYLVSFRVSAASGCLGPTYRYWDHAKVTMLGLAVLDRRLRIIHEAVFDINNDVDIFRGHILEDHRLFYLPWHKKKQKRKRHGDREKEEDDDQLQLFLSSGNSVLPLHVSTRSNFDDDDVVSRFPHVVQYLDGSRRTRDDGDRDNHRGNHNNNDTYTNADDDAIVNSLVLRVPGRKAIIRIERRKRVLDKNYQFFPSESYLERMGWTDGHRSGVAAASSGSESSSSSSSSSDSESSFMVEEWPESPRELRIVTNDFNGMGRPRLRIDTDDMPPPSFVGRESTLNATWKFRNRGRGSACCLRLPRDAYERHVHVAAAATSASSSTSSASSATTVVADAPPFLWFGIEHIQSLPETVPDGTTPPARTYVSRFYAFSPRSPYRLVARSGLFCLAFTTDAPSSSSSSSSSSTSSFDDDPNDDGRTTEDPFAMSTSVIPRTKILQLGDDVYRTCPKIGYVSGMADDVDDDTRVIVSYGINDCSSRLVVLSKFDIADRLFLPPALWNTTLRDTTTTTTTTTTS